MELTSEEIFEVDNICLHDCILKRNFMLQLLFPPLWAGNAEK